jgi:hypothetical protein
MQLNCLFFWHIAPRHLVIGVRSFGASRVSQNICQHPVTRHHIPEKLRAQIMYIPKSNRVLKQICHLKNASRWSSEVWHFVAYRGLGVTTCRRISGGWMWDATTYMPACMYYVYMYVKSVCMYVCMYICEMCVCVCIYINKCVQGVEQSTWPALIN